MKWSPRARFVYALLVSLFAGGCFGRGANPSPPRPAVAARAHVTREPGKPAVATLTRDGDPSPAIAVLVRSDSDAVGAALATLVKDSDARVVAMAGGVRVDATFRDPERAAAIVSAVRSAVEATVDEAAWGAASKAVDALPAGDDEAEASVLACAGKSARHGALSREAFEAARKRIGPESVVVGLVGGEAAVSSAAQSLSRAAAWGHAQSARPACANEPAPLSEYATTSRAGVDVHAIAWRPAPLAVAQARAWGAPGSALLAKLEAEDRELHVAAVTAVASPRGACVDVRWSSAGAVDAAKMGKLMAIAKSEMVREPSDGTEETAAVDARDAAAIIASAELSSACATRDEPSFVIGVAGAGASPKTQPADLASLHASVERALASAWESWRKPAADVSTSLEIGQPMAVLALGSPCGTRDEDASNAGATATVLGSVASSLASQGIEATPFVGWGEAGLVVSLADPKADARTIAERVSRALLVDPITWVDPAAGARESPNDAFAALSSAITAGHESWLDPRAVSRFSKGAFDARLDAIRSGPVRAAVIANAGGAQARAMAEGLDRFVPRREARACTPEARVASAKPGTYAAPGPASEAYLALPIDAACTSGDALAALLSSGTLASALSGLARSSDAKVLGAPSFRHLVVHVAAPDGSLDAAVAQTRALLDRLRRGAFDERDVARARGGLAKRDEERRRDPRLRALAAWRAETPAPAPTLEGLRACAEKTLRDEALVIAVSRSTMSP